MKQCPRCRQTYSDDDLNFCLEDGELLTAFAHEPPHMRYVDDPPTVRFEGSRVTNPVGWPMQPPPGPLAHGHAGETPVPQFGQYSMPASPNQTLAAVSLALGVGSITIGWCCSLGVVLSPAALITGFIALSQIKKDPGMYRGQALAVGGIVTGAIYIVGLVAYLIFMLFLLANGSVQ